MEPFLINPARYKRRRKKSTGTRRRKRRGGLPSALLKRMVKTHGIKKGMKEAWKQYRKGVRKNIWTDDSAGHATAARKGWRRRKSSRKRYRKNLLGEEVMLVGTNRRRRRRRKGTRRNAWRGSSRKHAMAARKGWGRRRRYSTNPRRRRRYYPLVARRRRRYARNPARAAAISIRRPMSILMPAAFGTAGYMASERLPSMVGMLDTYPRLGVKAAVALAGPMVLGRFLGQSNATYFAVGAGINLLQDVLNTFVFKTGVAGLQAFPYEGMSTETPEYGAFPGAESVPY